MPSLKPTWPRPLQSLQRNTAPRTRQAKMAQTAKATSHHGGVPHAPSQELPSCCRQQGAPPCWQSPPTPCSQRRQRVLQANNVGWHGSTSDTSSGSALKQHTPAATSSPLSVAAQPKPGPCGPQGTKLLQFQGWQGECTSGAPDGGAVHKQQAGCCAPRSHLTPPPRRQQPDSSWAPGSRSAAAQQGAPPPGPATLPHLRAEPLAGSGVQHPSPHTSLCASQQSQAHCWLPSTYRPRQGRLPSAFVGGRSVSAQHDDTLPSAPDKQVRQALLVPHEESLHGKDGKW